MIITLMIATVDVEPGWAVGSVPTEESAIDRDLIVDGDGLPCIPGSSLAGSLRAHLVAASPPADVRLMGSRPPSNQAESAASSASPLWVIGAAFQAAPSGDLHPDAAEPILETIGQTAIDRKSRAARAGSLRISRLTASGGRLTVYLRHDAEGPLSQNDLQLIAAWHPSIGRDRTSGGGRARLAGVRYGFIDPATPDGARIWLTHDGPQLFEAVATMSIDGNPDEPPWLEATFDITDGLLIGDHQAGQQTTARKRGGKPFIPGSAWKGIIRSRTEFIIRSRYGENAACTIQAGCGDCVVCDVFGHQGRRGTLVFRDSYIEHPGQDILRTHVAIDRVTGGARDTLLFETSPVPTGLVRLRIDQLAPPAPWIRNVIIHVLRDLDDGLIGVGSRTTTGLGTLRLTDPAVIMSSLEPVVVDSLETHQEQVSAT
jgi:CRISPR/Cas system CSM-associated protein Csm3 (group 7 of RAMP superfamily)